VFKPEEHLMNLKGKQYLQVMWRIAWMRDEHPDWGINTELVDLDKEQKSAIFRSVVCDADGHQIASATGSECARDFADYIEKAETKALGRALAMAGYGTQFVADEFDEGSRIVDSPAKLNINEEAPVVYKCRDCGCIIKDSEKSTAKAIADFGRKKFGRPLCEACYHKAAEEAK